jgi:tRNA-dihydrouridine synthase
MEADRVAVLEELAIAALDFEGWDFGTLTAEEAKRRETRFHQAVEAVRTGQSKREPTLAERFDNLIWHVGLIEDAVNHQVQSLRLMVDHLRKERDHWRAVARPAGQPGGES